MLSSILKRTDHWDAACTKHEAIAANSAAHTAIDVPSAAAHLQIYSVQYVLLVFEDITDCQHELEQVLPRSRGPSNASWRDPKKHQGIRIGEIRDDMYFGDEMRAY